ncbi:MAG: glycosyltransferase family 4 protein [Clostridia bacterium]|nr:glycosyltransferase family 4 protein [Clostridia bacterium]
MSKSKKTVLILVNKDTTIVQFRLEVVAALVKAGYDVVVSTPIGERTSEIEAVGARILSTPMEKDSTDPIKDFILMLRYFRMIREVEADIVLTYTIKPNVYGGMASALRGVPYVANITGLGAVLGTPGVMQKLALFLYRLGFSRISKVFFQNDENKKFFENHKIAVGKHMLLPGSGVNLKRFDVLPYPCSDTIHFAFISRIRKEKGIEQYVDAAKSIQKKYHNVQFHVCGYGDERFSKYVEQLHNEGIITYHGLLKDVRVMLKDVHCVIHPTYYPEGMSNVLLESAATGRAIISTDRPGCREAIDDGVNGYIIREKDSADLIDKVEKFMNLSYEEKKNMGLRGREKVEREFDRNIVVNCYLETVSELTR